MAQAPVIPINSKSQPAQSGRGLMQAVQDPILKQIVKNVERTIPADFKESYAQIVAAGMTVMFSESTHSEMDQYLDQIKGPQDVPNVIAHGIVKLIATVQNQSKKQEPLKAIGPASITLMAEALEFMETRNGIDVDKKMVDETTMLIKEGLFSLYKITPEVMQQLQAQGQKPPSSPAQPNAQPQALPAEGA